MPNHGDLRGDDLHLAGVRTLSVLVTIPSDTFVTEHVVDLGQSTVAYAKITTVSITPDGEIFGTEEGNLIVDVQSVHHSPDGISWRIINSSDWFNVAPMTAAGQVSFDLVSVIGRYLRYSPIQIAYWPSFETYIGPNHPTATLRIDVEYL